MLALEGLFSGVDVGVLQVVRLQMERLATARMVADKVFHFVVYSLDVPSQGIICGIGRAAPPKITFACLLPLLISRTNHDHLLQLSSVFLLASPVDFIHVITDPGHLLQLVLPLVHHL